MDEWEVVLLGLGGVGKTAIVTQFTLNCFEYDPTIEDGFRKQISVDDRMCFLKVIDTAGQEEYGSMREQWIRESQGFILVYCITSRETLDDLRMIRQSIMRIKGGDAIMVLLGNKCELEYERAVSMKEGAALAKEFGCEFFETSAKTAQNVDLAFMTLVRALRQARDSKPPTPLTAPPTPPAGRNSIRKRISRLFSKTNASPHRKPYQEPPNLVHGAIAAAQQSRITLQVCSCFS
ncbi:ras protein [Mycena pura]|uniref:Ras protein n=1 Tax=Mycena pura TaxID=153505 RepID=A0AAD6YCL7_9AGAR|nr:ras protein [Mycena pura]